MKRYIGAFFLCATVSFAGQMTYLFTGEATGTLGATNFEMADFTLTTIADTSAIVPVSGGCSPTFEVSGVSTIGIAGVGTATLTGPVAVGVCQASGDIFFTDPSQPAALIVMALVTGPVLTYDLSTPFAQQTQPGMDIGSTFMGEPTFGTTMGTLTWQDYDDTFSAAAASVPEPATWGFMLAGCAVLAGLRARRKSA